MRPPKHDGDSGKHCDVSDQRTNSQVDDSSSRSSAITSAARERRAVEEVWEGHRLGCKGSRQRPRSLQDFVARPLDRPPPANATSSSTSTVLGLSPSVGLEIRPIPPDSTSASSSSSISPAFSDANRPPSAVGLFFCSKKLTLPSEPPSDAGVERRHKRIMKNRESAARSRARKQAYVNQLELEIAQLLEENSRLKKEIKKLSMEMAAKQLYPLKNKPQRSATAPF
ncbi:bZIP transcription factor 27-like [Curcuma longa]|uniref:bZIP transcription factor 27-like n=1 Tax=Curcuma longa TaxID=136217 RepID=UPI003D9EA6C5